MLTLSPRIDGFRFLFPKTFLAKQLKEKYGEILVRKKSVFTDPTDFLNETIKSVTILGLNEGTVEQNLPGRCLNYFESNHAQKNEFMTGMSRVSFRNPSNPLSLIDLTFNVQFRHTLGYLNYFMLYENFFYQYMRDYDKDVLENVFNLDLLSNTGSIIARVQLDDPLIYNIDNLSLNFTQSVAEAADFSVGFKFSNIDYQFIGTIESQSVFENNDNSVNLIDNNLYQ